MAESKKAKKDNKNLLLGICATVAIILVVVIAVVLATHSTETINDAYFVSDDTKYVLTLPSDIAEEADEDYAPVKTHMVYKYSGDDITDVKMYYEYEDSARAKAAYDAASKEEEASEIFKNASLNGKYIIITTDKSEYENLKASDIKKQIELYEMFKNMDFDESEDILEK